jgi:hypothetical protein
MKKKLAHFLYLTNVWITPKLVTELKRILEFKYQITYLPQLLKLHKIPLWPFQNGFLGGFGGSNIHFKLSYFWKTFFLNFLNVLSRWHGLYQICSSQYDIQLCCSKLFYLRSSRDPNIHFKLLDFEIHFFLVFSNGLQYWHGLY